MTTIAYRDGVLAADTLVCESGRRVGRATKIFGKAGVFGGVAGCLSHMNAFRDWFLGGMTGDPPSMKTEDGESEAFIVHDGYVLTLSKMGWDVMRTESHAVGSGGPVALGAMASGASAEEAVKAAISLDVWSGGDITVLRRTRYEGKAL